MIRKVIQLATNKVTEYKKMPARLVNPAANEIVRDLTSMFNQYIDKSIFPNDLVFVNIAPAVKAKP